MPYIKTENPDVVRDLNSKAIIFTNNSAREEFRQKAAEKQKLQNEINTLRSSIEEIKNSVSKEISEIKQLIIGVISDRGNLNG
jgi:predicted  nucleic acid-binding Zn-ribbon protein